MNKIRGKHTSLTLLKNNIYTPFCYTEETLRQTVVDYALPATIGKAKREIRHQTGTKIEGCFSTRLDADCAVPLFDVVSCASELFTLLANRVFSKGIFTFLKAKSFELRAANKEPFYFRVDVEGTRDSSVEKFSHLTPVLKWNDRKERKEEKQFENENCSARDPETGFRVTDGEFSVAEGSFKVTGGQKETFFYDGFSLVGTRQNKQILLPLIYRFELNGDFCKNRKFFINLYYALSDELYPELESVEKILIPISAKNGMFLELNNLKPTDDRTNIRASDEVLIRQKFWVGGEILFLVRNKNQYTRIEI